MQSRIIAVDLAKDVFEIAVANRHFRILERHRLSRPQFAEFLHQQAPALLLFEACDAVVSLSGLLAVTIAGVVVGNSQIRVDRDLRDFKEAGLAGARLEVP